jgi:hypothetical protein
LLALFSTTQSIIVVIIVRIMRLDVGTSPAGLGFPAFSAQTIGTEALVFITLHAPVLFVAFSFFFFQKRLSISGVGQSQIQHYDTPTRHYTGLEEGVLCVQGGRNCSSSSLNFVGS